MKTTSRAALLAAVTGMVLAAQTNGAFAQRTLFDILFGNDAGAPRQGTGGSRSSLPGQPKVGSPADFDASDPDPLPTVKAPQYFTYKPDPLRVVNIPALNGPLLTGSVATATDAPQPAPPVKVTVRAENNVAAAMEAFYAKNDNLLWIGPEGVTERARAAIGALAKADNVGLDPADYKVEEPQPNADPAQAHQDLMKFEVQLTKAVLTFVQDDIRGRIDPNRISDYYDFKRKDVNLAGVLKIIQHSPDVAAYLSSRSPQSPEFQALQAELMKVKGTEPQAAPQITVADGTFIRPGGSSPEMSNIVALIKEHGSDALKAAHQAAIDGYAGTPDYTPELVDLVKGFQQEKGAKPDGVIGKGTIRLLQGGESGEGKVGKLIYAMEELRWLPNDLGSRRVFINQPAFMAYYFNDNKQQLAMKVVVGGVNHQTNFFQDQIETVEFNPYWGVPRSIIVHEMMPKLRQDPSYLDRMGYEVSVRGNVVSSSSLDWGRNPDVDVRQPPGNANALGQLKILFPNKFSIYMHDTPQKSFFARDMRALSHGCVRLSDPRAMAAAVLGTDLNKIAQNIATGKNMSVQVPQKIPVYVAYFTAWPDTSGNVQYYDDVYKRDMYLQRAFDATTKARAAG